MASLLRPLRRAFLSLPPSSPKTIIRNLQNPSLDSQKLITHALLQARSYQSEMRKYAFLNKILRLIRNQIEYELEHCPKPPADQFDFYTVDCRPGDKYITLKGTLEEEDIKIDATMFDGYLPVLKSSNNNGEKDVKLHITFIVDICKRDGGDILEFHCSAWPNYIVVRKVYVRPHNQFFGDLYMGPEFKLMGEDMQEAFMDFLKSRGINDNLAVFLHECIRCKVKTERILWMRKLMSSLENKN